MAGPLDVINHVLSAKWVTTILEYLADLVAADIHISLAEPYPFRSLP